MSYSFTVGFRKNFRINERKKCTMFSLPLLTYGKEIERSTIELGSILPMVSRGLPFWLRAYWDESGVFDSQVRDPGAPARWSCTCDTRGLSDLIYHQDSIHLILVSFSSTKQPQNEKGRNSCRGLVSLSTTLRECPRKIQGPSKHTKI